MPRRMLALLGLLGLLLAPRASGQGSGMVPCSIPAGTSLADQCFISPDEVASGGMGARMLGVLHYFSIAVDSGCVYLHQPLDSMGHKADAQAITDFLGFAEDCLLLEDAKRLVSIREEVWPPEDSPLQKGGMYPLGDECSEQPRVLCLLGRARHVEISFRAMSITRRVLRAKYDAAAHPAKALAWFKKDEEEDRANGRVPIHTVLHIRRGDVSQLFQDGKALHRYTDNAKISTIIRDFVEAMTSKAMRSFLDVPFRVHVHIASDGGAEDFPDALLGEWAKLLRPVKGTLSLHLARDQEGSMLETFAHMADADVLLHGVSSFPGLAARWYSTGVARVYAPRRSDVTFDDHRRGAFDSCFVDEVRDMLLRKVLFTDKLSARDERPVSCGGARVLPKHVDASGFVSAPQPAAAKKESAPDLRPKATISAPESVASAAPDEHDVLRDTEAKPREKPREKKPQDWTSETAKAKAPAQRIAPSGASPRKSALKERLTEALAAVRSRKWEISEYYEGDRKVLVRATLADDINPADNAALVARIAVKILRAVARELLGQTHKYSVSFTVAAVGGKAVAGYPGSASTSFMAVLEARVAELWRLLSIDFRAFNAAIDSFDISPAPQLDCIRPMASDEADMVVVEVPTAAAMGRSVAKAQKGAAPQKEEEAVAEMILRRVLDMPGQHAAVLLYLDRGTGGGKSRAEALYSDIFEGAAPLGGYRNHSITVLEPFGKSVSHLRWRSAKMYGAGEAPLPPTCGEACSSAKDYAQCDVAVCPLRPRMGDGFHEAPQAVPAEDAADVARAYGALDAGAGDLFAVDADAEDGQLLPFLLGHELIGNQLAYQQLTLMERALKVLLDFVKLMPEGAGFLSEIVGSLRERTRTGKLPLNALCSDHACRHRLHCFYAHEPRLAEGLDASDLFEPTIGGGWKAVAAQPEFRCDEERRARTCDGKRPEECALETRKCNFPGWRRAWRGTEPDGPLTIHLVPKRLKLCRVHIFEPEWIEAGIDMVDPLREGERDFDEDERALAGVLRGKNLANWRTELAVKINGKRCAKGCDVRTEGNRFWLDIDLPKHFGENVCRGGAEALTITLEMKPVQDIHGEKLCQGSGRMWSMFGIKKLRCTPEGKWLGYDMPRACREKKGSCQLRSDFSRDPKDVAYFISHVVAK